MRQNLVILLVSMMTSPSSHLEPDILGLSGFESGFGFRSSEDGWERVLSRFSVSPEKLCKAGPTDFSSKERMVYFLWQKKLMSKNLGV